MILFSRRCFRALTLISYTIFVFLISISEKNNQVIHWALSYHSFFSSMETFMQGLSAQLQSNTKEGTREWIINGQRNVASSVDAHTGWLLVKYLSPQALSLCVCVVFSCKWVVNTLSNNDGSVVVPCTEMVIPRPCSGCLLMWQSLGLDQRSPLEASASVSMSTPRDTAWRRQTSAFNSWKN